MHARTHARAHAHPHKRTHTQRAFSHAFVHARQGHTHKRAHAYMHALTISPVAMYTWFENTHLRAYSEKTVPSLIRLGTISPNAFDTLDP